MATEKGMKILNLESFEIEELPAKDSLPQLNYFDIIEGKPNEVCLASDEGLVIYNYKTKACQRFYTSHGLQGNFFKQKNSLKTSDGKVWLGGTNGLNIFDPKDIKSYEPKVKIFFDEFLVNNEPIDLGCHINDCKKTIDLPHYQNSIELGFAAMDHSDNEQVTARYKIQGLSDKWIECDRKDKINFFQQPAGTYSLLVEATNSEGNVIIERAIKIRIAPPFWKTWWFRLLSLLLVLAVLYWFYQNQLKKRLASQKIENLKKLDQFKNTVYTNVTHEFKTPITIIQGYADMIKGNDKEKNIINRSSKDLLRLINQILDIAKLESGNLSMDLKGGDVIAYIKHLIEPIQFWAENEGKEFSFFFEKESWILDYDEQKLENIIINLLSNAVKFTREGGKIEMRVTEEILDGQNNLKIEVEDSGIGIAEEYQSKIFDRHFQVPKDKK